MVLVRGIHLTHEQMSRIKGLRGSGMLECGEENLGKDVGRRWRAKGATGCQGKGGSESSRYPPKCGCLCPSGDPGTRFLFPARWGRAEWQLSGRLKGSEFLETKPCEPRCLIAIAFHVIFLEGLSLLRLSFRAIELHRGLTSLRGSGLAGDHWSNQRVCEPPLKIDRALDYLLNPSPAEQARAESDNISSRRLLTRTSDDQEGYRKLRETRK